MQAPALPRHEKRRISALSSLQLVDSPPEERFDRITRLAARLFRVPTALLSLVGSEEVFYKSRVGYQARCAPRDQSFCGHAIQSSEPLIVPDALQDERFRDNPLVLERPGIRFYAGCPITLAGGHRIGVLCILDDSPRHLTEEEVEILRDLTHVVEELLAALQLATVDQLTGLSNRRGFLMVGETALAICRRGGHDAAVLSVDIDRFKEINDTWEAVDKPPGGLIPSASRGPARRRSGGDAAEHR